MARDPYDYDPTTLCRCGHAFFAHTPAARAQPSSILRRCGHESCDCTQFYRAKLSFFVLRVVANNGEPRPGRFNRGIAPFIVGEFLACHEGSTSSMTTDITNIAFISSEKIDEEMAMSAKSFPGLTLEKIEIKLDRHGA